MSKTSFIGFIIIWLLLCSCEKTEIILRLHIAVERFHIRYGWQNWADKEEMRATDAHCLYEQQRQAGSFLVLNVIASSSNHNILALYSASVKVHQRRCSFPWTEHWIKMSAICYSTSPEHIKYNASTVTWYSFVSKSLLVYSNLMAVKWVD